ncbi:hypothetical protein GQ43DRAFT_88625 [Delitschia confertaspora ATCC 74209]|uniref:Uncharacterized protein n=1 Tax=Delitschia confertaspora ATCC 74209 TaxID=1513339 RepID=A0A9P4MR85_9PLEO|nr:hypothetical protein GQ43DRAFT_88625 [Delitschia confertaspora ATCC 74209]
MLSYIFGSSRRSCILYLNYLHYISHIPVQKSPLPPKYTLPKNIPNYMTLSSYSMAPFDTSALVFNCSDPQPRDGGAPNPRMAHTTTSMAFSLLAFGDEPQPRCGG